MDQLLSNLSNRLHYDVPRLILIHKVTTGRKGQSNGYANENLTVVAGHELRFRQICQQQSKWSGFINFFLTVLHLDIKKKGECGSQKFLFLH